MAGTAYGQFLPLPFPAAFELSSLNGTNGFVLNGIDSGDRSGQSVSCAGDVNGDGVDDLIIGAREANPNGSIDSGESYVVFGRASCPADVAPQFGVLNANDVIEFVNAFNTGSPIADLAPAGGGDVILNVNDLIVFVGSFNAGCP
jgi:hypothetical protein